MKKFYLYIESYTFIRAKNNTVLIYNSLAQSGQICSGNNFLTKIIHELLSPNNNYCIEICESQLKDNLVANFVDLLRRTFSGDLVESQYCGKKPFSLVPIVKLRKPIELLKKSGEFLEDNISHNFQQLTLYLNGLCDNNCSYCTTAYKQFICCTKSNHEFSQEQVSAVTTDIVRHKVKILNIVGGDILSYPHLQFFLNKISNIRLEINIFFHYLQLLNFRGDLSILNNPNIHSLILFDSSVDKETIEYIIQKISKESLNFELVFIIRNVEEYSFVSSFCEMKDLSIWQAKPLFTNDNYKFFEEFVFLTQEEILKTKLRKNEIFANQLLNIFDFGKLSIFADKSVYGNVNLSRIGTYNGDLTSLIYYELLNGESWFRLRNNETCNECILQLLCPSPSNYELAIGKPNLCHVIP